MLHELAPVFFWRDYGHWCFARHDDVSVLLRDRHFGRQLLHVMSRAELGWPEPPAHLAPFAAYEQHALLELEPPAHTRMRTLVNRPFLARVTERLRPRLLSVADELVSTAMLFLIAGHEATVHAIGNAVRALLAQHVDVRAAFATPEATARTVEELLRFDTPLHLFTRHVLEDSEIAGVEFARGERIGLLLGAANHDPTRFAAAERCDPGRTPNPHLSFGGGIHFCVGAPLARLELQIALPLLFERPPGLSLAAPARYRDAYHFRGLESLWVRWRPG